MGIDPGLAIVGYSLIDNGEDEKRLLVSGSIQTDKNKSDAERLCEILSDMDTLLEQLSPDCVAVEKLYYSSNIKTATQVAQAKGVILATLAKHNIPYTEYTPTSVKQVITGYGKATKNEVAQAVKRSVSYQTFPKLDDTVDSIAIALCHSRNLIGDMKNG